jgi:tRNA (guanosine-2'-O-)-methyltransferase
VKKLDSTKTCLAYLERKRFISIGTLPHIKGKTSVILYEGDCELALEKSEMCITIPILGMIENLNLGTSIEIVLYKVIKQRREYQSRYKRAGRKRPIKITLLRGK